MKSTYKKVAVALLIIFVAATGLFVYWYLQFRITTVSPKGDVLPNYSNEIVFFFNRDLAPINKGSVTITPAIGFDIKTQKNELHIYLNQLPSSDKLAVKIANISSNEGEMIKNIIKSYNVSYVPPDKLSDYDKKKALTESDSFESRYPIIKSLPIFEADYTIDYKFPDFSVRSNEKLTLVIDVTGINDNLKYSPGSESYLSKIRSRALDKLSSLGFSPSDYTIEYAEK